MHRSTYRSPRLELSAPSATVRIHPQKAAGVGISAGGLFLCRLDIARPVYPRRPAGSAEFFHGTGLRHPERVGDLLPRETLEARAIDGRALSLCQLIAFGSNFDQVLKAGIALWPAGFMPLHRLFKSHHSATIPTLLVPTTHFVSAGRRASPNDSLGRRCVERACLEFWNT